MEYLCLLLGICFLVLGISNHTLDIRFKNLVHRKPQALNQDPDFIREMQIGSITKYLWPIIGATLIIAAIKAIQDNQ